MALASRELVDRPSSMVEQLLELKGVDHAGVLCRLYLLATPYKQGRNIPIRDEERAKCLSGFKS